MPEILRTNNEQSAEGVGVGDFAKALLQGYVNRGLTQEQAQAQLQTDLSGQITAASADSRISNRTDADVKTILGMP